MNSLVEVNNNAIVVSSIAVAQHFEKEHRSVLRSINEILAAQNCAARFFTETTFNNRGKEYPMYLMNRDGFSLLAMGFTGDKAMRWKIKYIEAFNQMEKDLNKQLLAQPKEKIKGLKRKLEWNRNARREADERHEQAIQELFEQQAKYNKLLNEYKDTSERLCNVCIETNRLRIKSNYINAIFCKRDILTRAELDTINNFIEKNI